MKGSYPDSHIRETRIVVGRQGTEERYLPRVLVDAFPDGFCWHVSTMMEVEHPDLLPGVPSAVSLDYACF
jgi:hypothetical protein